MDFPLNLPPSWHHTHVPRTSSTMTLIRTVGIPDEEPNRVELITADFQDAGHGQRGTVWEADEGKNLLFSFAFRPQCIRADHQFFLSEALALAVCDALQPLVGDCTVKWPNDIYWNNRKICGMLLEHTLCGQFIDSTRTGVGINENQQSFKGDAPNPVSIHQIMGKDASRKELMERTVERFVHYYGMLLHNESDALHTIYMEHLYRRTGFHPYRDASGQTFEATIADIAPTGLLTLQTRSDEKRTFAFKEISFVIR